MWLDRFLARCFSLILQRDLPVGLRFYVMVPLTVGILVQVGNLLPLPPGPLCDEGMVLFMEGGCDWGNSNIFFYSKLVLLLALNVSFLVAARMESKPFPGFLPHLLLLAGMASLFTDAGRCDTYYDHPNGNLSQMIVEGMAFAVLGMALLTVARGRSWRALAALTLAWNAVHVAAFYGWLSVTDHWTWLHTVLVCGTLLALAVVAQGGWLGSGAPPGARVAPTAARP
jgi:hypothetical protein